VAFFGMSVTLRTAEHQDISFLWYLRNRPDVYRFFKHPEPVSWEGHVEWVMCYLLGLHTGELKIIQWNALPVGQVRLDYEEEEVEISISILNEFRGKGIALRSVEMVCEMVKSGGGAKHVLAEIYKDNQASIKMFEKCGFVQKGQVGDFLHYIL